VPTAIKRSGVLKAVADPLRVRIGLLLFEDAHTVKELAAALDVPATRLYYHVKILEQHGLIEVVERRMVSGIEERTYRSIDDAWNLEPMTPSALADSGALGALFGAVQAEMEVAFHDRPERELGQPDSAVPVLVLTELLLSADDVPEVQRRMQELLEQFDIKRADAPPGAERYGFLVAGYARPGAGGTDAS
jgi:DNA-binding transcriptional ArsR family regulator